ncbi:MAG: FCD domain-containing protein [Cloacibacillus sp.]
MFQSRDDMIYNILLFLKESDEPAGAGSIQRYLETKGFAKAEATVGRILRDMDCAGYTEKRSNQGRAIAPKGEEKFSELEQARWHDKWTEGFLDVVDATNKNYLLDLLAARLPVETAVARLAALHATQKEVDALCKIVREQEKQAKNGAPVSALDTEFHRTLAAASHNQILEAIVELLRKKEEYSKAFEKIRRNAGHLYNSEHRKIYEAIEARDPELAELTMKRHLSNLIDALSK